MRETRRLFDVLRRLRSRSARHADIGQHDVGRRRLEPRDRLIAVADGDDVDFFVGERQLDDALNGDAVIGQKKGLRHLLYRHRASGVQARFAAPRPRTLRVDEVDDLLHRRPRQEHALYADRLAASGCPRRE